MLLKKIILTVGDALCRIKGVVPRCGWFLDLLTHFAEKGCPCPSESVKGERPKLGAKVLNTRLLDIHGRHGDRFGVWRGGGEG